MSSAKMFANQTCQFKHGHLRLPKYGFEFVVCIDIALVDFVLQVVLFNINPELADHLSAGKWCCPHNGGQSGAWR